MSKQGWDGQRLFVTKMAILQDQYRRRRLRREVWWSVALIAGRFAALFFALIAYWMFR